MLYDRPYMRLTQKAEPNQVSMVTSLMLVTIAVFVLQQVLNVFFPGLGGRGNRFLTDWFALSGANFRDLKVWTVLSYCFLHSTQSFMHILGNMLGLFFIGRIVEPILGKQRFLWLYLGGAVVGGLFYVAFHINGVNPVIGASAAVFAVITFFCMLHPEQPITLLLFFVLPITVKPKWIFWFSIAGSAFSLLFYELPGRSTLAHSAHLGGIAAGILYFRFVYSSTSPFAQGTARPHVEPPEWFKRSKHMDRDITYRVNRTNREELQKEVDRILDKINASGFGSLSEDEKTTLDRAKDILSH